MKRLRRKRASAIAFSVVLALVLVVLGVGFLFLSLYMGAQSETKNAVDAGALNVGKQTLDDLKVSVILSGDDKQSFFRDVTDKLDGVVNLRNINRVWNKALMVAINADAAAANGNAGSTDTNVQAAQEGAQEISDALQAKLADQSNLEGYFDDFAKANSVRMIGTNAKVAAQPGANWQTSLMDREKESNIEVLNLPVGYTLDPSFTTPCTRNPVPSGADGKTFLKGYVPIKVANQTFWQVPYLYDQKPHLVARSMFDPNKQPPNMLDGWDKAVPNAFSVEGVASKPGAPGERAVSWVQTNPRQLFPMQFPHGFIRVVVKQNTLQWHLDLIPMDSTTYESTLGTEKFSGDGIPYPIVPICATVSGDATVGNEYVLPNLYFAIFGPEPPNLETMDYLLQRCQEMQPDCTKAKLIAALQACFIDPGDSDQTFYIYPDPTNTFIVATPDAMTVVPIGCDKTAEPEGTDQTLDDGIASGPFPLPNFALETFTCDGVPVPDIPVPCTLTIERKWKPGTGYQGGCLGELTIHHTSDGELIILPCSCPV